MSASAPKFSVVIPTCGRNDALALCLDRLAPGDQERMRLVPRQESASLPIAETYEVIVTDDGRHATAQEMIRERFSWAHWTAGPARGPAANRNHGAREAKGDWFAFTDDDCLPDAGWLAAFAKSAASHESLDVLEGRTYVDRARRHFLESSPINENGGNLWSCNLCVRRAAFEKLGGFDEDFPFAAMEDMEFHERLKESHARIAFVREAGVLHPWIMQADWPRHFRRHLKSQMIYAQKHPKFFEQKQWFRLLLRHLRTNLLDFIPNLLRWKGEYLAFAPLHWRACAQEVSAFRRRLKPESIVV